VKVNRWVDWRQSSVKEAFLVVMEGRVLSEEMDSGMVSAMVGRMDVHGWVIVVETWKVPRKLRGRRGGFE
jgi:hypothetical protein